MELGEDWDKDDIQAYYISNSEDESVKVSYVNKQCLGGNKEFGVLKIRHFSPYAIYDLLNNDLYEGQASVDESDNLCADEIPTTGDSILITLLYLFIGIVGIYLSFMSYRRKNHND